MDGKKVTIVGIIAILIGLLAGYLFWGTQSKQVASELEAARKSLAEAQQPTSQEAALAAKLQEVEAQLKQVTERLNSERELRQKLEAQVSAGKK